MKQAVLAVVAVVAVVAGAIVAISRFGDVSPLDTETPEEERGRAQQWEAEAAAAFGGADLSENVIEMVEGARQWLAGERPTEQFKAELEARREQFQAIAARLGELEDFPYDERVNELYRDSNNLYRQTVAVYQVMVDTVDVDQRIQLDYLARRLRILGDRVFDRGRALVKPRLHETPRPDVDMRLPEEVPDWVQEGIAPGPPLDDPPSPPGSEPRLRQPTRPEQPEDDWEKAVERLDAPGEADVRVHIEDKEGDALKADARALVAAAERLRQTPDPRGDRERATRHRLGLLVHAEAARVGQLAVLGGNDGLASVSRQLLEVGGRLRAE